MSDCLSNITKKKDTGKVDPENWYGLPTIIIKFRVLPNVLPLETGELNDFFSRDTSFPWHYFRQLFPGIRLNRLFTSLSSSAITSLVTQARTLDRHYKPVEFLNYFRITCQCDSQADQLAQLLSGYKILEWVYKAGTCHSPWIKSDHNPLSCRQGYLGPAASGGVDARYAWKFRGGDGKGRVRFIDIEYGWIQDHEDIKVQTLPATGFNHPDHHDHGAAVLGVIVMKDNRVGGIGITPNANAFIMSQWRPDGSHNVADAILAAISHLDHGDIILIEAQLADPDEEHRFLPVEIEEAIYQAIRLATALGIIVIEAGGNGIPALKKGIDLDRLEWQDKKLLNPLSPDFRDSGAIVVAAASSRLPHKRIDCSNFGRRIDCYAWGENVVTAGSYPRSSYEATDRYTRSFDGTSSAAAIIAGCAIAVQSIIESAGYPRIAPAQMRNFLSNELMGTRSANGHCKDRIGVMPDLKKIIDKALGYCTDSI